MTDDFLMNLAANLAYDLLRVVVTRLRNAAFGDAETRALKRTYQRAFESMLAQTAADLDPAAQAHLSDLLHKFVIDEEVASQLLDLALVGHTLSLSRLHYRFETLGFDPTTFPVEFDTAIKAFVEGLTEALHGEAGEPGSPLYNRVSMGLFHQLQVGQHEHQVLLHQMLNGQGAAVARLERWLDQLEDQQRDIQQLLTQLTQAAGERGVQIKGGVEGSIIVTGDGNQIYLSDAGRLARWWEEIGPDPDTLLNQYLNRTAEVCAPLLFPFGYLSKPVLLDDVYLDLPIVKPPTDEALFRPSRRLSGNPIPRTDELLKQNQRAALVGILGMGKTTTLRYLTWVYARRPENRLYWRRRELVPFYARIRDLAQLWTPAERMEGLERFVGALAGAVSTELKGVLGRQNVARVLQHALEQDNALILLDALDEFQASEAERLEFVTALQSLWNTPPFRDNHILLTSRPYHFLNPLGFGQYALQNLEEDAERLVSRLGWTVLRIRHELEPEGAIDSRLRQLKAAICTPRLQGFWSPLYITLMVYLGTGASSTEEGIALLSNIHRLADLFRYFLKRTVEWEKFKGNDLGVDDDRAISALGYIAYHAFVVPGGASAAQQIAEVTGLTREEFMGVRQFWLRTGLLCEDELRSILAFQLSGFQAFGVALALADMWRRSERSKVKELRDRYEWDPEWDLIWELFAGLV